MTMTADVRRPVVAGVFYAGSARELRDDVGAFVHGALPPDVPGTVVGLVVPHAGYLYSGATAAHAYALLKGRAVDACILVGPSHQEYFSGVSVYPGTAYATPLGRTEIDADLRDALLAESPIVRPSVQGHRGEHSLEVQIPFIQSVLPDVPILPLVMGDQSPAHCFALGEALGAVARGLNVVLIASSDLSHFHTSSEARTKDAGVIALIEQYNTTELMTRIDMQECEACGGGPIVAVMTAAHLLGARHATILHACNSGDITGDTDRVVGYCSAALWKAA